MEMNRSFSLAKYFLLFIAIQYGFKGAAGQHFEPKEDQLQAIRKDALKWHNIFRSWHNAPPMTLDDTLNKVAQAYSLVVLPLPGLRLDHDITIIGVYGENLYGSEGEEAKKAGELSAKAWYDEFCDTKNWPRGDLNHFTQLIWKSSVKLGIGVAINGTETIVVGRYLPPGNVDDEVGDISKKKNLLPLACEESKVCNGQKLKEPVKEAGQCGGGGGGGGAGAGGVSSMKGSLLLVVFGVLVGMILLRATV